MYPAEIYFKDLNRTDVMGYNNFIFFLIIKGVAILYDLNI